MLNNITKLPPVIECHGCGSKMRRATKAEINLDLQSNEYKHLSEISAQGSLTKKTKNTKSEWREDLMEQGSWLLRCDGCGARVLWSSEI